MKSQYEQHCNAAALKRMGVPILKNIKKKRLKKIAKWIDSPSYGPTTIGIQLYANRGAWRDDARNLRTLTW